MRAWLPFGLLVRPSISGSSRLTLLAALFLMTPYFWMDYCCRVHWPGVIGPKWHVETTSRAQLCTLDRRYVTYYSNYTRTLWFALRQSHWQLWWWKIGEEADALDASWQNKPWKLTCFDINKKCQGINTTVMYHKCTRTMTIVIGGWAEIDLASSNCCIRFVVCERDLDSPPHYSH